MIKFLNNNQIDRIKWNNCVNNSINSLPYAFDWYLDVVAENWAALVENDYESIMPLVYRKKAMIHYIFTPFFTQQLGIFSTQLLDNKICERFLSSIPHQFRYLEYNLNSYNQIDTTKYTVKNNINHLLDLIENYDALHSNFSENLKRNLRKAEKAGIIISQNQKPEDIIDIFIKNKGKELNNLSTNEYAMLKKLIYTGIHKGVIQTYGAYTPQNELCAGAIFLISNHRAIFLFSATNAVSRQLKAMPFLINSFIRQYAGKNIILDFEGSNDSNLARFYKSFGSKTVIYPTLTINKLPFLLKTVVFLIKRLRKLAGLQNNN